MVSATVRAFASCAAARILNACECTLIPVASNLVSPGTVADHCDDAGVAAWATFLRTHAAVVRRLERELADERGLALSWYDVLLELNTAPERRLRMQQLAARVVLSRTRVSRVVEDMVRDGLVAREPDPTDRRATFAVITTAGRKALRTAAPVYLRGIREQFSSHLSERELRTLERSLAKVLQAQQDQDSVVFGTQRDQLDVPPTRREYGQTAWRSQSRSR